MHDITAFHFQSQSVFCGITLRIAIGIRFGIKQPDAALSQKLLCRLQARMHVFHKTQVKGQLTVEVSTEIKIVADQAATTKNCQGGLKLIGTGISGAGEIMQTQILLPLKSRPQPSQLFFLHFRQVSQYLPLPGKATERLSSHRERKHQPLV